MCSAFIVHYSVANLASISKRYTFQALKNNRQSKSPVLRNPGIIVSRADTFSLGAGKKEICFKM